MNNQARIADAKPSPVAPVNMGRLLLEAGKLTEKDIERIVTVQHENNLRFGDAAVQLGLVNEADILRVLSRQFKYPCLHPGDTPLSETLVAVYQPFSASAEALRALRSQLILRWFGARHQFLTLIGACEGEGCSRLAANLAIVLSQLGDRTLLIDADLRHPKQDQMFGLKPAIGLSQILVGRAVLEDAEVSIDSLPNLSLLCAGSVPPNPQELLSQPLFREMLERASKHHDVVILDTPPALVSADAQIIAARAGGCLLVTRRHTTRLTEVSEVKERLTSAGVEIVGAVING